MGKQHGTMRRPNIVASLASDRLPAQYDRLNLIRIPKLLAA